MYDSDSSDSDSDHSINLIEQKVSHSKKHKLEDFLAPKQINYDCEMTEDKQVYLKKFHESDEVTETSTMTEH